MPQNVASGNDRVAVQVGRVLGRSREQHTDTTTIPDAEVESTNIRSGNASVGRQVDEIRGGLTL